MEERILMAIRTTTDPFLVGLPISDVKRVVRQRYDNIYPIPKTSDEVLGLVNENGATFPVFDLSLLISTSELQLPQVSTEDEYVAVIVTTLHGYQIGLAVSTDPDFYSIGEDLEDTSQDLFSGKFELEASGDTIYILDLPQLFPNVEITETPITSERSEDDDLDMSQYVLSE